MTSKGESFFTKRIGLILGVVTTLIVAIVFTQVAGIDFGFLTRDVEKVKSWETFVVGTWEWVDRDGGDQIFQFHPNKRYDYYLKMNPQGGGFGTYKLLNANDETAVLEMIPAADSSAKWKLYMKRVDSSNIDIRMGDPDGEDYTRLTRI